MKTIYSTKSVDGFAVRTLANEAVSISLVPELGGRIVSLHDRKSDREWLDGWQPEAERRLWKPTREGCYESGPMAGIDECLPTVLPCRIGEAELPDHGDLWSTPTQLIEAMGRSGILTCFWTLNSLPLKFERSITLDGGTVRIQYRLENLAEAPTPFLWAWHPLFTREAGDQIQFHSAVESCLTPEGETLSWPEAAPGQDLSCAELADASPPCAKVFVGPLDEGRASILGSESSLHLQWDAKVLPWAGIWINQGVVKSLHHWSIEPTNCPVDRLAEAPRNDSQTTLAPLEVREWEVLASLGEVALGS